MDDTTFLAPFERLIGDLVTPEQVRAAEQHGNSGALWGPIADSGFLDALVPESCGGAGLSLRDVGLLIEVLGRHLVPEPVADTIAARGLMQAMGIECPAGRILLATATKRAVPALPEGQSADYILCDDGVSVNFWSADNLARGSAARPIASIPRPDGGLRPLSAVLRSAEMAGAAAALLDMSVAYANERIQFGKPIGRQQAIQQQLAVLAEKVVMVRMAARIGCACELVPHLTAAAMAKGVASAAVDDLTAIAHAVHGAIGISQEHDLQLFTRRLHYWRLAEGSESYWWELLGEARLASRDATSAIFVRGVTTADAS